MAENDPVVAAIFMERMESLREVALESLKTGKLNPAEAETLQSASDEMQILGRAMTSWIAGWERDGGQAVAQPIAVCMWRMMLDAMLIGQHATLTESAKEHFRGASLKAARDAKPATAAAKEYDKIVARVANEYEQKNGRWKLSVSSFADHILAEVERRSQAALLPKPGKDLVRKRVGRLLSAR